METKISIIGAGSAVFSLNLIRDICLTPNLSGSTVSLMDIDEVRLEAAFALCQRYAGEVGTALKLERTTDRRRSLQGADFVINTVLAGGHSRLRDGFALGKKHGYHYASYHIMHDEGFWINYYQFRLFESVVQDMLDICPQAWLLQVANPVLAATTYLSEKYPQLKMVGLCHGYSGVYQLAHVLGLEEDEHLTFEVPGVNHFVWLTRMYYKGEDVFPLIDRWIEEEAPRYWETSYPSNGLGPKAVDLYRRFGAFPIGDTCTPGGGSWPYWYHSDPETERRWHENPDAWWDMYFAYGEANVANIQMVAEDTSGKVTDYFPPNPSREVMVPIIESIACDIPRVIIGNLPNSGDFVPGVPRNYAVEIPTLVSRRGIQGIRTHGLPGPLIAYILRDRVAPINIELAAYEAGSRELLRQLLMMDPWTRSQAQADALLDDILALPGLEEMREHYR